MRSLIPTTMSHLELGHAGYIMGIVDSNLTYLAPGLNPPAGQLWVEWIFGKECGNNTVADSTSGTRYYPQVEYVVSVRNQSRLTSGAGTFVTAGIQCKSWHEGSDNFSPNYDHYSRNGNYDPSDNTNYIFHTYSEDYMGKFSRVAIEKSTASTFVRNRFIIIKGEGL